jgi:ribosomal protein S18 acetylase RimI-like enzyme
MLRYSIDEKVSVEQFAYVLKRSTLGQRRPIDDVECLEGMIKNSNLIVTCWNDDLLVGIARSMTDFHWSCYISDLAVDASFQKEGIGKKLIALTQNSLGKHCKIVLLAAPSAKDYYSHIGFEADPRAWVLPRNKAIKTNQPSLPSS